jgi:putative ABC transport system permease protein
MDLREGILLALGQIRAQKLKSFFAVLGVIIGVMFLITVVSVVEGMNRYMEEDFARTIYGLNTLTLSRQPEISFSSDPDVWRAYRRRPRITFADADAIRAGPLASRRSSPWKASAAAARVGAWRRSRERVADRRVGGPVPDP